MTAGIAQREGKAPGVQKQHLQEEMEQRAVQGGGMDPEAMKQLQAMQKSMMEQMGQLSMMILLVRLQLLWRSNVWWLRLT